MNPDADSVLDAAHELRVSWRRHGGQVAGSRFSIHREHAAKRELHSPAIAPGADGVRKPRGLGAAFQTDAGEGVGHEALAEPGIDRPEQQISVRSPHQVRLSRGRPRLRAER
jgi:hypothetical protein